MELTLHEPNSGELGEVFAESDGKDADSPADGEDSDGAAEVDTLHKIVGRTFELWDNS